MARSESDIELEQNLSLMTQNFHRELRKITEQRLKLENETLSAIKSEISAKRGLRRKIKDVKSSVRKALTVRLESSLGEKLAKSRGAADELEDKLQETRLAYEDKVKTVDRMKKELCRRENILVDSVLEIETYIRTVFHLKKEAENMLADLKNTSVKQDADLGELEENFNNLKFRRDSILRALNVFRPSKVFLEKMVSELTQYSNIRELVEYYLILETLQGELLDHEAKCTEAEECLASDRQRMEERRRRIPAIVVSKESTILDLKSELEELKFETARLKEQESVKLLFLGSPLLDVTSQCSPDVIRKYNLLPDSCLQATSEHEELFREMFHNPESRMDSGGSALNSAKIAKWAIGCQGQVAFAGCVGNDECASRLESKLKHNGVETLFVRSTKHPTGVCACLLTPDGKRSMCTRHGADSCFEQRHLEEEGIQKWLRTAQCVFVVGYFAAHSPDVIRALSEKVLPNQLFSLSLSAEYICREFKEILLEALPRVDILFANEGEIRAFATALGIDASSTEHAARAIASKMERNQPGIVVVTRGPESVIIAAGGQDKEPRHFPVPSSTVRVVDSVGCGDALAGAFLAVYVLTGDVDRAAKAGITAAVEIAQVHGCQPPARNLVY